MGKGLGEKRGGGRRSLFRGRWSSKWEMGGWTEGGTISYKKSI